MAVAGCRLQGWCNVDLEVSAAGVPRRLGLLQRDAGGDAVQPPRPRPRHPAQPGAAAVDNMSINTETGGLCFLWQGVWGVCRTILIDTPYQRH